MILLYKDVRLKGSEGTHAGIGARETLLQSLLFQTQRIV